MLYKYVVLFLLITLSAGVAKAESSGDEPWREEMKKLIYSSRYFGPNALPIPTMHSGSVSNRWEVEVRGEYHRYSGDKTKNWYGRLYIPLVNNRVAVEVSCTLETEFETTPETKAERFAAGTKNWDNILGDVIIGTHYQILRSEKWVDLVGRMYIRTATGQRLALARYTDAAGYWFDLTFGKNLLKSTDGTASLRVHGMGGFYCWMTNSLVHRQDDAYSYAIGLTGKYKNLMLQTDYAGYTGYENNGDRPRVLRSNLSYELKKNILSFKYSHGMRDNLYDSYSIGYIRCF